VITIIAVELIVGLIGFKKTLRLWLVRSICVMFLMLKAIPVGLLYFLAIVNVAVLENVFGVN
jgi:hypothetical protein